MVGNRWLGPGGPRVRYTPSIPSARGLLFRADDGAGYETHGPSNENAGGDGKPGVVANKIVDGVGDIPQLHRDVIVLLGDGVSGIADGMIYALAKLLDLRVIRIGKLREQLFRAIDQLIQFGGFFHGHSLRAFLGRPYGSEVEGRTHHISSHSDIRLWTAEYQPQASRRATENRE